MAQRSQRGLGRFPALADDPPIGQIEPALAALGSADNG